MKVLIIALAFLFTIPGLPSASETECVPAEDTAEKVIQLTMTYLAALDKYDASQNEQDLSDAATYKTMVVSAIAFANTCKLK